jgi:hypothetical protein
MGLSLPFGKAPKFHGHRDFDPQSRERLLFISSIHFFNKNSLVLLGPAHFFNKNRMPEIIKIPRNPYKQGLAEQS